jgi:hypothetical protein
MNGSPATLEQFDPHAFHFYRHALAIFQASEVPFLVGGAYAFDYYTGIARHTKDLDVFLRSADVPHTMEAFKAKGYRTEMVFSHWLAKAYHGNDFIDLIFSSGNGLCDVDDVWFEHAVEGEVLGVRTRLVPVEEMIWQKSYIMERERFDGADVLHLLRARGRQLAWGRLLDRYGQAWRVLLGHLILFGFVYPADRESVPAEVLQDLVERLRDEPPVTGRVCRGPILSRTQYLADLEEWGYADPRLAPSGPLTREQAEVWTDAGR